MKIWRWATTLLLLAGCILSSSCSSFENEVTLQGAGATFPAPLYKRWFLEYYKQHPDVRTNYQAIGSGAGIRQFSGGYTHFGASDEFKMPDARDVPGGAFLIPMTAGSIALAYNLPEGTPAINLSRDVYVDIFLGLITKWNHPAIASDNPGVQLPNEATTVIRRADSSGTTYAFSNHSSAISPRWKKEKGPSKSIVWPQGFLGGKGNAGVAALIQQTPGAIGYLEYGYADLAKLSMAHLQNRADQFVAPGPASGKAALGGDNAKNIPDNLRIEITNPAGDKAYPIEKPSRLPFRRARPFPRQGHLREDGRPRRGSPLHRHGLSAAESVCDEHLPQRLVRSASEWLPWQSAR